MDLIGRSVCVVVVLCVSDVEKRRVFFLTHPRWNEEKEVNMDVSLVTVQVLWIEKIIILRFAIKMYPLRTI